MYFVRRAFRNNGQMMAPGSVVEPAAIKRFRSRLAEGRIVEVTEHSFSKWQEYFKVRFNVEIAATGGTVSSVDITTGVSTEKEPEKEPEKVKPVTATVVAKVR